MTDPITAAAALTAATVYIARTAYELVLRSRNGNGEKQKRCEAELVARTLQASMDAQTALLKDIKDNQRDTRDGVLQLVAMAQRE